MSKKTGTSMSYAESSPAYRRRRAAQLRAEELSWAARSGPVRVIPAPTVAPDDRPAA